MALNPFAHDHGHHHHHHHGDDHDHDHHHHHHDEDHVALDPAQQSLADALKVSFALLTAVMVILVVLYLFSGVFTVHEQQAAVVLRFGKIVGDPGEQVLGPGMHFTLPYPVSSVEIINTSTRQIAIDQAFMYEVDASERGRTEEELAGRAGPLNPERDGSLITGDANIVHARFSVTYQITDPVAMLENVGLASYGDALGGGRYVTTENDRMIRVDRLVQLAAEQAIIEMVAGVDADAVIRNDIGVARTAAQARMQAMLDQLHAGVTLSGFTMTKHVMPLSVRAAYQAMTNAESEKTQKIDEARKQKTKILGEVAGPAAQILPDGKEGPLVQLVNRYQHAAESGDQTNAENLRTTIEEVLDKGEITYLDRTYPVGGQASQIINQANTYRTQIVERVKGESERFTKLLERFRDNPELLLQRRWQEARAEILGGDVETLYIRPDSHLRIDLTGDPQVAREREEKRLKEQQEQRQQRPN